ncbi:MAG: Xaa-Pro peptidase family protein [Planctomycetaceae bacterium]
MSQLERLQSAMQAADLSAFIVSDPINVRWLTGFTGSFAYVIVSETSGILISDSRYTLQAREQVSVLPTATFANPVKVDDFLYEHLQKLDVTRLGFDQHQVSFAKHSEWKNTFAGIELTGHDDPITDLRAIKTSSEIDSIRAACRLADDCMAHVTDGMQPGITELELLTRLETFLRSHGSETSFDPIIVSGPRSARPHGVPSLRALEVGDLVTIDLGAVVDGYCSDITRTVVMGPASERQREVYAAVLGAEQLGIEGLRPGANGREIDATVRSLLDESQLAQYFGHGLGHGLGTAVHDTGRLSPTMDQSIEAGQVWTVEPGVYIEGFGGIRIEDDVLVTDDGPEVLTFFPTQLLELPTQG